MKKILLLCFIIVITTHFGNPLMGETIFNRDSVIKTMTKQFKKIYFSASDSAIHFIDNAYLSYKNDTKVKAWKFHLKGLHYYYKHNMDSSLSYFTKSLNTISQREDPYLFNENKIISSTIYKSNGESIKSLATLKEAEKKINSNSKPIIKVNLFRAYGNHYNDNSNRAKAIDYYLKALKIIDKDKTLKPKTKANLIFNLAEVFQKERNYIKAISYYNEARVLCHKLNFKYGMFSCDLKIAQILKSKTSNIQFKNLKKAIHYFESIKAVALIVESNAALSTILLAQGKVNEAELIHIKSLKLSKSANFKRGIMDMTNRLGKVNEIKQQYDKAIKFYSEALKLSKSLNDDKSMINCLENNARIYSLKNDYKKAFYYSQKIIYYNDSFNLVKNNKVTQELEAKYHSDKKEQEIILLKSQKELAIQQKKNQKNTLMGGILLATLGSLFFFIMYRNKQKTNQKLKELDATKSTFFENISHEFRTPLTLIKLPIKQAIKTGEPISKKHINTIYNNTNRLQNLIEDLLAISAMEANSLPVHLSTQNPLKQVNIISSQFDSLAESNGIKYIKDTESMEVTAKYDKSILNKILVNLISNAIKYSNNPGEVRVSSSIKNNKLLIEVSDKGIGLSKEDQHRIFDRFYQVSGKDESSPGSGIGLALVKDLVELNQGEISVKSQLGKGSTFNVILPLTIVHNEITNTDLSEDNQDKSISIIEDENFDLNEDNKPILLIVEDNIDLLNYIKEQMESEYKVHTATNGKIGLEKALKYVPNLIISDWMMPEMNGIDLCKNIKTNAALNHIPFILLTAKANIKDKVKGYETGADAYFPKPFEIEEVKAQITNIISQRKLLMGKFSTSYDIEPKTMANNTHEEEFWTNFKSYLNTNISDPNLTVQNIADHLLMSRMQLHRKVKVLADIPVGALITKQRMKMACTLLSKKDCRISEVGFDVGYNDVSTFSRSFKKEFGKSPKQYVEEL